jgi:UDP-galactopyranose mutase
VQRFQVFIHRQDPTIVTNEITSAFPVDDILNLNELGFKLAFGLMDNISKENMADYSRIQWEVNLKTRKDQIVENIPLRFKTCTEEDYAVFYPVKA